jgi:flagellar export protein FliJ
VSRFTFRLEPGRALREQAERQAKEALARQLVVVAVHESAVAVISDAAHAARASVSPPPGSVVDPRDVLARQAYADRLQRDRELAQLRLAQEEREADARRSLLEKAAQERETLERARSKAVEEHRLDELRHADDELGEVALATFRRSAAQGAS